MATATAVASVPLLSLSFSKNSPSFGVKFLGFGNSRLSTLLPYNIGLERRFSRRSVSPTSASLRKLASFAVQKETSSAKGETTPFGYTRKDVLLIGLGVTVFGFALEYGLEFIGLDSLKAGNVVQLVMVLGLTVGWILTYILRVSTKDMTYAQQLRDYEDKVLQKRLEELPEAELEVLLAQVEEEKLRIQNKKRDGLNT